MFDISKRINPTSIARLARRLSRPSAAMTVAGAALFRAVSGGDCAADHDPRRQRPPLDLAANSVWHERTSARGRFRPSNLSSQVCGRNSRRSDARGGIGPHLSVSRATLARAVRRAPRATLARPVRRAPQGDTGAAGPQGPQGIAGINGLNAAVAVVDVPTIAQSSGKNANPDSGDAGDAGWYFSGNGAGGSAALSNGELELDGPGVDVNTAQGGIGIAKAFNNVPLSELDALTYQWHVNEINSVSKQAPTIHITVTGLTNDSKYGSGFANLVYNPTLNGVTPTASASYQSDAFAPNAAWYSTTESNNNNPGGQNSPETLATFANNNPHAVITQISLDNGGTSHGTGNFDAGADNLLLGFSGINTRYDFGG